jgi:dTDP-4-dehydrorhamnose 3,5-epimerase
VTFGELPLAGAYVIDVDRVTDERGFFVRTWCREEFATHGLPVDPAQLSISMNWRKGTLRGMHLQAAPHEETKIVRCSKGAIYDVVLDLRRDSATFGRWHAVELTAENGRMLFVPPGCAHGFQTLEDASEVTYLISEFYHPASARGVRWNDPAFAIEWPLPVSVMSTADRTYADFVV